MEHDTSSMENDLEWVACDMRATRRHLLNMALLVGAASLFSEVAADESAIESVKTTESSEGLMTWPRYLDLLKSADDLTNVTLEPSSSQIRAELYRQLAMNLASGYFLYFQSDSRYPDWMPFLNSVFTLQPNPDDTYWVAPLDPDGTYRIVGTRGSVRIVTFLLSGEVMGTSDELAEMLGKDAERPATSAAYGSFHDANELTLGQAGEFEVLLSRQHPEGYSGDWWALPAGMTSIMVRQRSYDWSVERDARFAIERLDQVSSKRQLKPRMTAEEIDVRLRKLFGGYTARLSRMWLQYQKTVYDRGVVNQLEFALMGGSIPQQVYWQGMYEFGAEEALILEADIPKELRYWNVQLNDALWNATEFVYRQSSLNGHQAQLDSDGKFRAVISLRDPGIWNWLDPAGYQQGMLIGRWYEADAHPLPTLKRVPFERIHEYLLPDTPRVTEAERTEQLRKRHIGGQLRRRW